MNLKQKLAEFRIIIIVAIFILINLFFNSEYVYEIIFSNDQSYRVYAGDEISYQYFAESFYQNLLKGQNPFTYNSDLLYPLGTSTALQDLGFIHTLYFIFFRPFLTMHNSLLLGVIVSMFLSEICMYLLLRQLKVSTKISVLIALVFSFSPFMNSRIYGHYSYMHYFLFPLLSLLSLKIIQTVKTGKQTLFQTVGLGLSFGLLLYANLYYTVMYFLFIVFYGFFYLVFERSKIGLLKTLLYQKLKLFSIAFFITIIFTLPLLIKIPESLDSYSKQIKTPDAYIFSAYATSFFVPSDRNPFYQIIFGYPLRYNDFFQNNAPKEGIIYLGIVIFIGIGLIIHQFKMVHKPLLLVAITFLLLSLGPELRLNKQFDTNIPMPYELLHQIPFVGSLRSPVRFAIPLVFGLSILSAIALQQFLQKSKKYHTLIIGSLFTIFLIDQAYFIPHKAYNLELPLRSYDYIKTSGEGTVLEVPYVIQDGYLYWGDLHKVNFEIGQLIHKKPVIGGFLGRLSDAKFLYYLNEPALSYFGATSIGLKSSIISHYVTTQPNMLKKFVRNGDQVNFLPPSLEQLDQSLKTLQITSILLKKDLPNYLQLKIELVNLNYKIIIEDDRGYTLLTR